MSLKPPTIIAGRRPLRILTLVGVTAKRGPTYAAGQVSLTMSTTGAGRRARRVVGSGKMMMGASGLARVRRRTTGVGSMSLAASAASRRRRRSGTAATTMSVATSGAARRARRSGVGTAAAAFNANSGSIVKPSWVAPGPIAADMDFRNNRAYRGDVGAMPLGSLLTVQRSTAAYIDDLAGNWTLVPPNTLRRSDKGTLIEGQQTNSIRNNSMQGAVAGTPGTLPTNWNGTSTQDGLSRQVVGVGSESGIDYIDIRVSGTPTASGIWTLAQPDNAVAGANGQLWTFSQFTRLSAGGLTNISNMLLLCSERDSAQGNTGVSATNITPTSAALASQRVPVSRTFTGSTTAFARGQIQFNYTSGQPVDFTIRIGWPQLEQWNPAVAPQGGASSPIRTTGAAATRAADVVSAMLPSALSAATIVAVARTSAIPMANNQNFVALSDGTMNERINCYRNSAAAGRNVRLSVNSTTGGGVVGSFPIAEDTRFAYAAASTSGEKAVVVNGGTVANDATANSYPVNATKINVGTFPDGSGAWNGYVERIYVRTDRVANANLPALSTLAA